MLEKEVKYNHIARIGWNDLAWNFVSIYSENFFFIWKYAMQRF